MTDELEVAQVRLFMAQEALQEYLEEEKPDDLAPPTLEERRLRDVVAREERRVKMVMGVKMQAEPMPAPSPIGTIWVLFWIGVLLVMLILGIRWILGY